ncbi:MAG: hypothetical protein WAU88_00745 [Candidatus Zixiibacteriota bacterium]
MNPKSNRVSQTDPSREHHLHVCVSHALREELRALARKYDRTTADMVRSLIKIGVPLMQGISEAEQVMLKEYHELFRTLRTVKSLKDI